MPLPTTTLGASKLTASRLGLGGFHQVEISSEIVSQIVDAYLAAGGSYIETARSYGRGASEQKLGRALAGRREQVTLVSKSSQREADGIRQELEASLEALQTDHLDFYFLHNVMNDKQLATIQGKGGALEALLTARDEGLVKGIGFSSHRPPMYLKGIEQLPLSVILIWDNFLDNLYLPIIREEVYPLAREKGVAITAMKPLADGFLYRSPEEALRFTLGGGCDVVVCGMNTLEHVQEGVRAISAGPLSEAEHKALMTNAPELGTYVCRQCGVCPDSLMELFRLEGYHDRQMIDYLPHDPADYALRLRLNRWFALHGIAKQRFRELGHGDDHYLDASKDIECPYNIDVMRKALITLAKLQGRNPAEI